MASSYTRGGIGWILGKMSSLGRLPIIGTGCSGSGGITIPEGWCRYVDVTLGDMI